MNHLIIFVLSSLVFINAQVYEGYTLFTPMSAFDDDATTYFMNNDFDILHTWTHDQGPASMPYLLQDSSIIYPYRVAFPTMVAGGVGGGIQKQSWDGEILWEYEFANEQYQHHHDVEPLPNGNILIIVWEKKTAQEAYDMGRDTIGNPLNVMWSSAILELEPESGEIVWEWHIWDHTVQDVNSELSNFGIISEHPELFDINCGSVGNDAGGPQGANADWMHINAIHYNSILDQIVISSRTQNEIFILDHSTSAEEVSGHSGGNSGMGGDFLYRWGNPENYGRGSADDKILGWQHSVNWIDTNYPGGGNLIIFNNVHFEGENIWGSTDFQHHITRTCTVYGSIGNKVKLMLFGRVLLHIVDNVQFNILILTTYKICLECFWIYVVLKSQINTGIFLTVQNIIAFILCYVLPKFLLNVSKTGVTLDG